MLCKFGLDLHELVNRFNIVELKLFNEQCPYNCNALLKDLLGRPMKYFEAFEVFDNLLVSNNR